jgi:lysophospholipase L1-like esterase
MHIIKIDFTFQIMLLLILMGLLVQIVQFIIPNRVGASYDNMSWSWTTNEPTVYSSTTVSDIYSNTCLGSLKMMVVIGEFETKKVCMSPGENIRFGTYYAGNEFVNAISFGFDDKMYKVWGACSRNTSCIYLPNSDTLVTKQFLDNRFARSLVIYKNFSDRLKHTINGISIGYNFDDSNPDYIFRSTDDYAWPIEGFGASEDGKWVGVEIKQRGIGLINVEKLESKIISTKAFSYGTGYDPSSEIAVSNGGHNIAVMGLNSGFTIYDVNSDCGKDAIDSRISLLAQLSNPCQEMQINTNNFINRFYVALSPKFSSNGGELSFYTASHVGESREVSLRAFGYVGQRIDYLALGDSFTSGEGDTQDEYYLRGTNDKYEKCHVSTRSYPYLIAKLSIIDSAYMRNVACSGAITKDVIGDDMYYSGQSGRLGKNKLDFSEGEMTIAKTEAGSSFLPGRIHQESFVKEYQPKIITIGIGGNDVGFMDKLKDCIGTDICSWTSSAEDKEQTAKEIKNLYSTLVSTYQKIHESSPKSKIYAIGYPIVIEENGKCDLLLGKLLKSDERRFMNEGVMYINQIIKSAAREVGVGFVDVQNSFKDQVLCGIEQPWAMNSIKTGDDGALIDSLNWFKVIGQESFHPNSLGHSYVANSIIDLVGDISDFKYCENDATICPINTPAPEPSTYWIPDVAHDYPTQKIADFVSNLDATFDNLEKKIILDNYSLAPNSSVSIVITSDPVELGQFVATSEGALNVNIVLPDDTEEGYHTIHLYGTSYSGELIELYQVIKYEKATVINNNTQTDVDSNVTPINPESTNYGTTVANGEIAITKLNNNENVNSTNTPIIEDNVSVETNDKSNIVTQISETSTFPIEQSVKGAFTESNGSNFSSVNIKNHSNYTLLFLASVFVLIILLAGLLMICYICKIRKFKG